MMMAKGYRVILYANGTPDCPASEHVQMLNESELAQLNGAWLQACNDILEGNGGLSGDALHFRRVAAAETIYSSTADKLSDQSTFHGDTAVIGSPAHRRFEEKLRRELDQRVQYGDIVCHTFGRAHAGLVPRMPDGGRDFRHHFSCEPGIGYPDRAFGCFRIFESNAWMHYHQGMDMRGGDDYECVVPNYFDVADWPFKAERGTYALFFGRVTPIKGMEVIKAIAQHIPVTVVGQGSKEFGESPGITLLPPVTGKARAELLGSAAILLGPSRFTEPLQGVSIEAMLCGTPVAVSDFGAMTETTEHGKTGWRCHTLGDYLEAIRRAPELNRHYISERARSLYSLEAVAPRYDAFFRQIRSLLGSATEPPKGWDCPERHYWIDIPECH